METSSFTFINICDLSRQLMPEQKTIAVFYTAYNLVQEWVKNNDAVMYEHEKYHFSRYEAMELATAAGVKTIVVHDCS